ncbi:dihydrolipoamide acetyltransferase family protein [Microbacterium lacus]|uniref:Dihydrolipoamide acetyltransferase component of pyruvate dehydrogenase complex n=1 Tax=Microbacterium lacus TaxID=415217 RepID=A0ABP4T065_9MICO
MATIMRMPAVMAGATEAALQSWLVSVGDEVSVGQTVAEIETEKAVFEHEADEAGVIAGLLVEPGQAVAVGDPIAVLAGTGETAAEALSAAGVGSAAGRTESAPAPESAPVSAPAVAAAQGAAAATPSMQDGSAPRRIFASPLVRRLAKERGLDLATIAGSGPGGRIVRRDVDGLSVAVPVAAPPVAAEPQSSPADATPWTDVPHTPMRRAIARRLTESKASVPHFYLTADCRVDALLRLRGEINADRDEKISVNDFVVKAVGAALTAVPDANAIWTPDATRRFAGADIAIAVSIEGGLVTPVVRGVDRMPLGELSATLKDLAARARSGRLRQQELEGGAFSVSNLGMFGIREFSAILNPPQSGILAVGAAAPRPVVGADGGLEVATIMTVTLSADHRVLDGALAAQWLGAFVSSVENPVRMLV